jgi:nitrogen fixation protein NifU and related proteins
MDLTALYQSIILDHNRRPRNYRELVDADRKSEGRNPLCGDELTVWLKMEGDRIEDVSFLGSGCAISKASASIMTTTVKGKTRAEASALFERFHDLVTGKPAAAADDLPLGQLAAFSGVSRFPVRVKCASLAWHALRAALRGDGESVSTERQ